MSTDSSATPKRGPLARFRRDPNKPPGRVKQVVQLFHATRRVDPALLWWMLLVVAGVLVVGLAIGVLTGHPIYATVLALPFAVLGAMFVLARRAEAAAFKQAQGQPGAASLALRILRRGWTVEEEPVAVDPRTRDTVFRAIGRPGVVLVSDGPPHRVGKLLATEEKRHRRVLSSVPIHLVQAGDGEGQVPLPKVGRHVMKLKPVLTKDEVSVVLKRVRSIGGVRAPIPKGVDPLRVRPDRKSMRGR
jgi:hypothetical protein